MNRQLPTGPVIRRHADGAIDYDFYRADANNLRDGQHSAAWQFLSNMARIAARRCRQVLSLSRPIDVVTRLR